MPVKHKLSIAVAGDIMIHGRQIKSAYNKKCNCYSFESVFTPAEKLFESADISIANLETTLPGKNYSGYPSFGAPDDLLTALKITGFDILTTANNHSIDKGQAALIRTLKVLDQTKFLHLGTYESEEKYERERIFILEKNGFRLAMLNYTYGTNEIKTPPGTVVNRIEKKLIAEDITLARQKEVDFVIVLYHFGEEYLNNPDRFQLEMVEYAFNEGADIVLGGHPHHIQPYYLVEKEDKYKEKKQRLVAYSLGNFVSGQRRRYTDGGMVFYFTLQKETVGSEVINKKITTVNHKLVWVYMKKEDGGYQFYILPIEDYINNDQDPRLSSSALKKMKRFQKDASEVLKNSP